VRTGPRTSRDLNRDLEDLLRVLEAIYWFGGGSAPSLNVADLVDPFAAIEDLAGAIAAAKGEAGVAFVDTIELLQRLDLRTVVKAKLLLNLA
jgi:hypothetical protein